MTLTADARAQLLDQLSFGRVDAESLSDLDRRFLRTQDFDSLVHRDVSLILGPKGSGKSTIFELFSSYEDAARRLAGQALDDVVIVTGTGLLDLKEVATADIEALKGEKGFDHEKLWRLYIALKCALALASQEVHSTGPVREVLRATGDVKDLRVLPLLRGLWRALMDKGAPSATFSVSALGASLELATLGRSSLDVSDLLTDVETLLEASGKRIWLLFDKVDELYQGDRTERQAALEGLFTATRGLRRAFPRIEPKIFLRTDIWPTLDFTNKTHLEDKQVRLAWSRHNMAELLLKGAAASPGLEAHIRRAVPSFRRESIESLSRSNVFKALGQVVAPRTRSHGREMTTMDWVYERVRDSHGDAFPRDAVTWFNRAVESERRAAARATPNAPLVGALSLGAVYSKVSRARRELFLTEFADLQQHFERFEGQEGPTFERGELIELMSELQPQGLEMLRALREVGVLKPLEGSVVTASSFEVPLLYRAGLGLTTNLRT